MKALIVAVAIAAAFIAAPASAADNPLIHETKTFVPQSDVSNSTLPEVLAKFHISDACCKHCSTGYACGNSCISRSKQCHKGRGCACDD
jgi:hypothetical protein